MDSQSSKAAPTAGRLAYLGMLGLLLCALLSWLKPSLVAGRFASGEGVSYEVWIEAGQIVVRQHALVFLGFAILWLLLVRQVHVQSHKLFFGIAVTIAIAAYVSLCAVLSDWLVDDAAITFAYSENLVLGYGLVLHPDYPPQEAYSNTLWMLLLAGFRALGMPIPLAAKMLGTLVGIATMILCAVLTRRLVGATKFGLLAPLLIAILLQAPYIVWSSSGLEHGMQGLGFVAIVTACAFRPEGRRWPTAILAALIFIRPEMPLIVAGVWGVFALRDMQRSGKGITIGGLFGSWSIAVIPALCLLALVIFRLWYFGDPLPTPFYAKAGHATFLKLLNPFGSGWGYVFDWATVTGMLCLLPLLMYMPLGRNSFAIRVALAIVAGQLIFVIYAGGDWMGCFRFMAALVPLLAVLLVASFSRFLDTNDSRRGVWMASVAAVILLVFSAKALVEFRAFPTTPMSVIAEIADEFVAVADAMGIDDPLLAHHDAGGSSYLAKIKLLDLGGLGDRDIAQNWDDPEYMRTYLFETKRPTFIFGAINFAARRSRFHEMPEFA